MKKTNFDRYLEKQLKDPAFANRFERAGEAWDVSLQLAALRQKAGLSQKELARRLKTSQQHISRLESPGYEGHSLANLRRVAAVLNARVRVSFEPEHNLTRRDPRAAVSGNAKRSVTEKQTADSRRQTANGRQQVDALRARDRMRARRPRSRH